MGKCIIRWRYVTRQGTRSSSWRGRPFFCSPRHVKHPSEVPRKALAGSHAMSVNKRAVKMAKLLVGELVISKRLKAEGDGQEWAAAKVVEAPGDGHYMCV